MDAPTDLKPLQSQPWDERPDELPLDTEECRTALYLNRGNITKAAETLKVAPSRLRNFVKKSAYLTREAEEFREQIVDKAEEVAYEALSDDDEKYTMARFILSSLGKSRGFNQNSATGKVQIGAISISWGDGTQVAGPVIEGEKVDEKLP